MQPYQQETQWNPQTAATRPTLHPGVVRFMNGVYTWMTAGLAVTALAAYLLTQSETAMLAVYGSWLGWVVMLSPLILVFFLSARIHRMEPGLATALFFVFSVLMGLSLAPVALMAAADGALVGTAFVISAGMFAGLALLGWTTKKDLSGWRSFLLMALIGLVLASVVNGILLQSSSLSLGISVFAVLLFSGLTAYDTQKIKQVYLMHGGSHNLAILGALSLYLDFINLFLSILRLLSWSRD
jgi:hypothetical protein